MFLARDVSAEARAYGSFVAIHVSRAEINSLGDVVRNHDASYATDFISFLYQNGIYLKPRKGPTLCDLRSAFGCRHRSDNRMCRQILRPAPSTRTRG